MSFVATLEKNLLLGGRRTLSTVQKLLWLALVLSISLCHQAAFASALSQLAASLQPGQFAELTGMNGFSNGQILCQPNVLREIWLRSTPTKASGTQSEKSFNSWALLMERLANDSKKRFFMMNRLTLGRRVRKLS